jgi:hypothetical protein
LTPAAPASSRVGGSLAPALEPAVLDRRNERLRELRRDRRLGVSLDRRYEVRQ